VWRTRHTAGSVASAILLLLAMQSRAQIIAGDIDATDDVDAVDIQLVINAALGISIDSDKDGLADAAEQRLGLNPNEPDTDGDGWSDLQQVVGGWQAGDDVPAPGSIVINEVLAHSHDVASDWIELYNTTDETIEIGGWFLSDDDQNLQKYEIAESTSIERGGYVVFYETTQFNNELDPGSHEPFALSENGDTVYLSSGRDGELTGYREVEDFGASTTGLAFGRYEKSTGTFNFVAMSENTPGDPNAYPLVGPVVISEIMYNPVSGDQDEEYIELLNISDSPVELQVYDVDRSEIVQWKFTDAIDFTFPLDTTIPAGGYLLVVKDPDAFEARYSVPGGVKVLGPYVGKLDNGGQTIEISMPGDVDGDGTRYIRVDRVVYDDDDPWPAEPDGDGDYSLTRIVPADYGNDVANWEAAEPTPGQ